MDRQTTFLIALGMLVAAASIVGVCGWVLFIRDRAFVSTGPATVPGSPERPHHREGREGS
jgi:hypothetical protein